MHELNVILTGMWLLSCSPPICYNYKRIFTSPYEHRGCFSPISCKGVAEYSDMFSFLPYVCTILKAEDLAILIIKFLPYLPYLSIQTVLFSFFAQENCLGYQITYQGASVHSTLKSTATQKEKDEWELRVMSELFNWLIPIQNQKNFTISSWTTPTRLESLSRPRWIWKHQESMRTCEMRLLNQMLNLRSWIFNCLSRRFDKVVLNLKLSKLVDSEVPSQSTYHSN